MKKIIFLIIIFYSYTVSAFPIPKNNKASFDIIRKNKIIGNIETTFKKIEDNLIVETVLDINIKVLFIPAYKFHQTSTETWLKNELIEFDGYTDFEDEREYYIKGKVTDNNFILGALKKAPF